MQWNRRATLFPILAMSILMTSARCGLAADSIDAPLPAGVKAVWDLDKAFHEKTPTRERVCLNGLWRWQPAQQAADSVPVDRWAFFKVPGFWPGSNNYIQEDCQSLHVHPNWNDADLRNISAAWHQREITIPDTWAGRRIVLAAEYVNSFAQVYVDSKKVGEIRFPAGEVDLTTACRPGGKHLLSLHVVAMPLKGVLLSYSDTNTAREIKGTVERRGLCGDVYLVSRPAAGRIADVKVDTSVRKGQITVSAALDGLAAEATYALRVEIKEAGRRVHEFTSKPFTSAHLKNGRLAVTDAWKPAKLWDIHTPGNML